jgi:hypothetical protein
MLCVHEQCKKDEKSTDILVGITEVQVYSKTQHTFTDLCKMFLVIMN